MSIPQKALMFGQLFFDKKPDAFNSGSHDVRKCKFIEDGQEKVAFYKPVNPQKQYPELLAKISVGASELMRLFQDNAAEDRLVFEGDKIVGTVSLALDGFQPLNCTTDPIPEDPNKKEQVIPSTPILVAKKMLKSLFARWALYDDDAHPGNLGLEGSIDTDMFFYWLTIYIKEPRFGIGVPLQRVTLTVPDWINFPCIKDAKPYHWPTYNAPGENTVQIIPDDIRARLPKTYANPAAFRALAGNPIAQDQKFIAALTMLMTYDRDMLKARLTDYLGDMSLNYSSLPAALRQQYETMFPDLFNADTNKCSFVDFMMALYQEHYDNLYRVVVFFMGAVNNQGLALPATNDALYYKPSYYKEVMSWAERQNATTYAKAASEVQYNPQKMRGRYHQIWRDSFAMPVRDILVSALDLTNNVLQETLTHRQDLLDKSKIAEPTAPNVTSVWHLFHSINELPPWDNLRKLITVDPENKLRPALKQLVHFTNELYAAIKEYYKKEERALTEEDNNLFVSKLESIYEKYHNVSSTVLGGDTDYAHKFNPIISQISQIAQKINFAASAHPDSKDKEMSVNAGLSSQAQLPFTDPSVVAGFVDNLFTWADGIGSKKWTEMITEILDKHYTPSLVGSWVSLCKRTEPVKKALADSEGKQANSDRLAYILSTGTREDGKLNTALILQLASKVSPMHSSISQALSDGRFEKEIDRFRDAAIDYAKRNNRFRHIVSQPIISLFFDRLFKFVDELDRKTCKSIVKSALNDYNAHSWWKERDAEVKGYLEDKSLSNAEIVAKIFMGGKVSSSMNDILFHKIVGEIQKKYASKKDAPDAWFFFNYTKEEHSAAYMAQLFVQSQKIMSHKLSAAASRVVAMS